MKNFIFNILMIVCSMSINNQVLGQRIVENINYNSGNYTFNDPNSIISPSTTSKPVFTSFFADSSK